MLRKRTIREGRRNGAKGPSQCPLRRLLAVCVAVPWALTGTAAPAELAFSFEGSTLALRQAHSGAGGLPESRELLWPEERQPALAALLRAYVDVGKGLPAQGFLSHHIAVTEQGALRIAPDCDGGLKRPCLEAFTLSRERARALLKALEDRSQERASP